MINFNINIVMKSKTRKIFPRRLNSDGLYEHPRAKTWGSSLKKKNYRKETKNALNQGNWNSDRLGF